MTVKLDAILVTTATHLLHARRQSVRSKRQKTMYRGCLNVYTIQTAASYRGGHKRGVASDGVKPNNFLMLHTCIVRFDVTETLDFFQYFLELLEGKNFVTL